MGISRISKAGIKAGLFQDGEGQDGLDAVVDAIMEGLSAKEDGAQSLPAWLTQSLSSVGFSKDLLMEALGVDSSAGRAELLAALGQVPLEEHSVSAYLAALYLGAVISGGTPSGSVSVSQAAEGLAQLLEKVAEGLTPDEAIELLTGGAFSGLEDFEAQFLGGTAPGLDTMLMDMLFSQDAGDLLETILALMAGGGGDMDMLMALLGGSGGGLLDLLDGLGMASEGAAPQMMQTLELGALQAVGQDLSGVSF